MTSAALDLPELPTDVVLRDRIVDLLATRWSHRVVAVVAGAGFGKSTALRHAVAQNRLAPVGTDIWYRCSPSDAVPSSFVTALGAACGVDVTHLDRDADAGLDELFDELARRWPLGVCLVVDDLHLVRGDDASATERVVRRLVREAPATVHFLLGSRTAIPGLARLRTQGQVVDVGEDQLRFDDAELDELADAHGVDPEQLRGLAGWPALAALATRTDAAHGVDAIYDAVAASLEPSQRRAVAVLVSLGVDDAGAQRAAVDADPAELLAPLPLVTRHHDGTVVPHQLWQQIVGDDIGPEERRAARSRAATHLLERGLERLAAPLFADAEDWDGFRAAIAKACAHGYAGPAPDVLASWLDRMPVELRDEPEGLLLRGVTARAAEPFSAETRDLLEAAMLGFRAIGEVGGEVAALTEYVYVSRARGEVDRLAPILMRLLELDSAGERAVEGPIRLGRALLAEASGLDEEFLSELVSIPEGSMSSEWRAVTEYLIAQAHVHLGQTADAVAAADRSARHGGPAYIGGRYAAALMRWFHGEPEAALALPLAGTLPGATPVDLLYTGMYGAMVDAMAGRVDRARTQLEVARRSLSDAATPGMRAEFFGAEAVTLVAEGDETGAADVLRSLLAEMPIASAPSRRALSRFLAVTHVLVPEVREDFAAVADTPLHRSMREVADAFVAVRDGRVGDVDWHALPSARRLSVVLPLRWSVEVAAAAAAASEVLVGRELVAGLAELHGPLVFDELRALAAVGHTSARKLLRSSSSPDGPAVALRVLGPLEVALDGETVEATTLRRSPVRALLTHLAVRSPVPRDELVAALWPDLGADAAANNLRVALSQLHAVLEPERDKDTAPFYVRTDPAGVDLVGAPHVVVDAEVFSARVGDGLRARDDGAPSVALDHFEAALATWRGEPLQDLPDLDWVVAERERLRALFCEAAVRAAELRMASGEPARAIAHVGDALAVEPWSEAAYQVLVTAHLATGDAGSASRALRRCLDMLASVEVAPSAETRMLERLVART